MERHIVVYIHGKGGNAEQAAWYKNHFPKADVTGFAYKAETPWEARPEFRAYFTALRTEYDHITIIANSIGVMFALYSLETIQIDRAFFISPIVNMEKLITDMLLWAGVTQEQLKEKGTIETEFGETLSWKYLCWVRENPIHWSILTSILYGGHDNLQSIETVTDFAKQIDADVTVMENGEHWFHTEEQMAFLGSWLQHKNER